MYDHDRLITTNVTMVSTNVATMGWAGHSLCENPKADAQVPATVASVLVMASSFIASLVDFSAVLD